METAFKTIGIEPADRAAFQNLTRRIGTDGEPSRIVRDDGVLHGRCLKLGQGLEVWSVSRESITGEIISTELRPAFRARHVRKFSPRQITEFDRRGKTLIHGLIENFEREITIKLQNLTETAAPINKLSVLDVGLCGLAFHAEVYEENPVFLLKTFEETGGKLNGNREDWTVCGLITAMKAVDNPISGEKLIWFYLDVGKFKLEVLTNCRILRGKPPLIGDFLRAEVCLQGHIFSRRLDEGIDPQQRIVDFWTRFKRPN